MQKNNIALIGMPAAGKSTVGVLLAKALGYGFVDTDIVIQNESGVMLQQIIDDRGYAAFIRMETAAVCGLDCGKTVIATGGSVVYSPEAMAHLRDIATVIYLKASLSALRARLRNFAKRGVLLRPGQSVEELYHERTPLYEKYAGATVECDGKSTQEVLGEILAMLQEE